VDRSVPIEKRFVCGTHRLSSPEDTVEALRGLLPVLGITRVANVTGLDTLGIPVVMVCRPNSRGLAVSQGKGSTLAAARASGLMESVEAFHAERIDHPLRLASFAEMSVSSPVVDVERIPRPVDSTFDAHARLLWIEGFNLLSGATPWLPFETVHTDFRIPYPEGSGAFFQSSNGLSSGNHILEAISHGICELIERDASSLWNVRSKAVQHERRLDLDTITDPAAQAVLRQYRESGVAVAVWETTSDVALPCFDCLIIDRELNPLRPLPAAFGAGCHPCREVALLRALTEAAQSRLTSISGSRDDIDWAGHSQAHEWETLTEFHHFIVGKPGQRSILEAPSYFFSTLDEDVEFELERLQAVGISEVVVVNLTKPGLDIPVVKVVCPGLETIHRISGYVPGPRARAVAEEPLPA
jgi:YcaO-like protein with predicted kinase domain